jgi:polyisoprenyl-teichoic acid--peptidoglycan teichoic acid transferase
VKRLLIILLITILFSAIVLIPGSRAIILSILKFNQVISPLAKDDTVFTQPIKPTPDPLKPISVLLLGYGGGSHEGGLLTDTIQIARIDPKGKQVFLISIPRDLYVSLPTSSEGTSGAKINAAFAYGTDNQIYPKKPQQFKGKNGGGNMAKYATEIVTGMPIDYYVAVNFDGFVKTIDSLGGIDINIQASFSDPFYPLEGKEKDNCAFSDETNKIIESTASGEKREQAYYCRFEPLTFEKGLVHMDGITALKFARSRHSPTDGGDFARSIRQKEVLEAVKQKMLTLGFVTKIIPFFQSVNGNIQTDIDLKTIQSVINVIGDIKEYKMQSIALTTDNVLAEAITPEGQYILIPKSGLYRWDEISKFINTQFVK